MLDVIKYRQVNFCIGSPKEILASVVLVIREILPKKASYLLLQLFCLAIVLGMKSRGQGNVNAQEHTVQSPYITYKFD